LNVNKASPIFGKLFNLSFVVQTFVEITSLLISRALKRSVPFPAFRCVPRLLVSVLG
jgi:hypothetical protein